MDKYCSDCINFSTGMVRDGDNGWDCSEPPSCSLWDIYAPDLNCEDCDWCLTQVEFDTDDVPFQLSGYWEINPWVRWYLETETSHHMSLQISI